MACFFEQLLELRLEFVFDFLDRLADFSLPALIEVVVHLTLVLVDFGAELLLPRRLELFLVLVDLLFGCGLDLFDLLFKRFDNGVFELLDLVGVLLGLVHPPLGFEDQSQDITHDRSWDGYLGGFFGVEWM